MISFFILLFVAPYYIFCEQMSFVYTRNAKCASSHQPKIDPSLLYIRRLTPSTKALPFPIYVPNNVSCYAMCFRRLEQQQHLNPCCSRWLKIDKTFASRGNNTTPIFPSCVFFFYFVFFLFFKYTHQRVF